MKRGERTCIVCSQKYLYCPNCGIGDPQETWRNLYDSEGCNKIFDVVSLYKNGHINKSEAIMKLKSPLVDLSDLNKYGEEYRVVLEELIKDDSDKQKEDDADKKRKNKPKDIVKND